MDPYIRVLLIEQEPDTISVVSLCLSEIKECKLQVCSSAEEALLSIPEALPDLVLLAHGLLGKNSMDVIKEIHRSFPALYVIVSVPEKEQELMNSFMVTGANDCVLKDKNYVTGFVTAVKKALIRISERDSFLLPPLSRAQQFVMDENLPDVVFNLDTEGKILYVNRALTELLGYEAKEVVGHNFSGFFSHKADRSAFEEFLNEAFARISFRKKVLLNNNMGIEEPIEIDFTLMEGETVYGVVRKDKSGEAIEPQQDYLEIEQVMEDSNEDSLPGRLGPYRVVTLLGAGSMGRVYKGVDEQLERFVAIKVLSKALAYDKDYLERFRREAKILASISHPNIALIYYFDHLEGLPYFCMEYLPGGSLEDRLMQDGNVDAETALSYTLQVALGLGEALEKGVIHLDIKPSNLMIAENNRIKLVDFGLARRHHDSEDSSESIIGTPLYIAPEQIESGAIDHRSDIYSLGLTFFQMLYGFVPMAGQTIAEVFRKRRHEDLPPYEDLDQTVPRALYEIIQRMTVRRPEKRYEKYADLIQDLENARRAAMDASSFLVLPPAESKPILRGSLYDQPFAEVVGEIIEKRLSGKLTLSWIDLCKNIHFKNGTVVGVLSNQEGESFIDILLTQKELSGKLARKLESASDLFLIYSSAMQEINPAAREKLSDDLRQLAIRILRGLFSWRVGEFFFEEGDPPGQLRLQIPAMDLLSQGIREWADYSTIRRRLYDGNCKVLSAPGFQEKLAAYHIKASDAFLLFRFEQSINFMELYDISAISEEEFYRIIYHFISLGIVTIEELETPAVRSAEKVQEARSGSTPVWRNPAPVVVAGTEPARKTTKRPIRFQSPATPVVEQETVAPKPSQQIDFGVYYYECASKSFREKNYWATVEYCKKALEYRNDARIHVLMGRALATHANFRHEAMDAYRKAMALDPFDDSILTHIGDLHFSSGNYALARRSYEHVLQQNPGDEHAINRLEEIQRIKKK